MLAMDKGVNLSVVTRQGKCIELFDDENQELLGIRLKVMNKRMESRG
jgi:hypothetical protein